MDTPSSLVSTEEPLKLWPALRDSLRGKAHDYTSGSIGRAILLLSIPMVLEMMMESLFGIVDIFFVGHLELRLLREAFDTHKPVFAICRGMQIFNVACGGTLIQHLDDSGKHRVRISGPSSDVHNVTVLPQTKLAVIAGEGERPANSRHHQAVGRLGEGLLVSALSSDDGIIEGIERPDHPFAIAVQWHPEDRIACDPKDRRLFEAFAESMERKA